MDEMRMVRDLFSDPPAATAGETDEARARLDTLMRPRRVRARWVAGGLGLAAAVTALAVVAGTQLGGTPERPKPSASSMSAGQVLLTAADSSARTPAKSGTYWFTHFQTGLATVVPGHHGSYLVEERRELKDWTNAHSPHRTTAETKAGRGGTTTHFDAERDLGARPVGPNVAAWKRDGSPSYWDIPVAGHPPWRISSKAGSWGVHKEETAFNSAFSDGSLRQLRELPTDPARLRAYFLGHQQSSQEARQEWQSADQWLFAAAAYLLTAEPVPPAVRVAAYRMLATLPGVRAAGAVTDPLGRPGAAVEMAGVPRTNTRLIVEPSSGRLLAQETISTGLGQYPPGTMMDWQALVEAVWTDQAPRHATVLPG